jgi:hypothetical protein
LFDTQTFLDHNFNNASGLVAFVAAFGYAPPSLMAAEKWFQRNSIPSDWLPLLLALLELNNGEPVKLAGYLKAGRP